MTKRLPLSRPRPVRGPAELAVSYALRLLAWHDEQFRRGWHVSELSALSAEDLDCLLAVRAQLGQICVYCHLVDLEVEFDE